MKILTIAREMGAIDYDYETALCHTLGIRLVHREVLESHFKELGANSSLMNRLDERKPGMMDSFFSRADVYYETLRTAIFNEIAKGDVAIVGRGANFILHDIINCIRLYFIAPLEIRVERIARKQNISKDQALACIKKSDRERIGFCNYYYGKDWRDAEGYDITINTAEIAFEDFQKIALQTVELKQPHSDHEQKLKNAMLTQTIRYALCITEHLDIRFLEVICDNGHVIIRGAVPSVGVSQRAENIVKQMTGVISVQNQLNIVLKNIPQRFE